MAEKNIPDLFAEYEARRERERQDALDAQAAQEAVGREGLAWLSEKVAPALRGLAAELNAAGHSATVTDSEPTAAPAVRLDFRFGRTPPYRESSLTVTSPGGSTLDMRHMLRTPHGDRELQVPAEFWGAVGYERITDAWLKRLGLEFVEAVLKAG